MPTLSTSQTPERASPLVPDIQPHTSIGPDRSGSGAHAMTSHSCRSGRDECELSRFDLTAGSAVRGMAFAAREGVVTGCSAYGRCAVWLWTRDMVMDRNVRSCQCLSREGLRGRAGCHWGPRRPHIRSKYLRLAPSILHPFAGPLQDGGTVRSKEFPLLAYGSRRGRAAKPSTCYRTKADRRIRQGFA